MRTWTGAVILTAYRGQLDEGIDNDLHAVSCSELKTHKLQVYIIQHTVEQLVQPMLQAQRFPYSSMRNFVELLPVFSPCFRSVHVGSAFIIWFYDNNSSITCIHIKVEQRRELNCSVHMCGKYTYCILIVEFHIFNIKKELLW